MKLFGLFFFVYLWCSVQTRCVMREECVIVNGFPKNCPYDGDPLPILANLTQELQEAVIQNLLHRCPNLILDEDGNQKPDDEILACCDYAQLQGMADSLLIAEGVLGRCPACVRNFARQVCEMNCSPDQARFVDVVRVETSVDGVDYVDEMNFRMHEDFMEDAYASCSGVLLPQTGMPAVNLMCGSASVCDAHAWFSFTGDTSSNPLAPVQVNFIKSTSEDESMHVRVTHCNETIYNDLPCNCIDCMANCPTGIEPIPFEPCTILSVNCYAFSASLIVLLISIIIIAFWTRKDYTTAKKQSIDTKPEEPKKHHANRMTRIFQSLFTKIGRFSAGNPLLMITLTTWLAFAMFFGVIRLNVSSNPIELWSAPDSRSRADLNYYNSRFGPFYRASQVFLRFTGLTSFTHNNQTFGPAFRIEAVHELIRLETAIMNIGRDNGGVTLEEVCYAPLRPPGGERRIDQCVTMSVGTYFGEDRIVDNNTYLTQIQNCMNNHLFFGCQATWGGGAEPEISFGGYDGDNIFSADTLLMNFPINNFLLERDLIPVLEWEQSFIDLMHDYEANSKPDYVSVAFGAERSIEDEIERVSVLEAVPIIISYILMFLYIMVALGNVRSCKTWYIESKIVVAIAVVIIVLISIFCAMGVMGFSGVTLTLLAINVVPFFVLSVGVDNVFLMVNTLHELQYKLKEYDDYNENFSFNRKRAFLFGKMLGKVGPSMFVSSVTQITCFAIGSLANFPAVVTFSVFVSISLAFLFVFQITTVAAILSIDYKRVSQSRVDVFCCIQKKVLDDSDPLNADTPYQSVITKVMEPYTKFLLKWWTKMVVVAIFVVLLSTSIMLIPNLEVGLDQEMSLPVDSYVYTYLQAVNGLLRLGPPVYFVVKAGLNYSDPNHQNVICGTQLCYNDSLTTQVFLAAQFTNVTYLARSSNSWLDDFFDWTSLTGACCQYNTTDGGFCRSVDLSPECTYCDVPRYEWQNGLRRPAGEAFERYIPFFLLDDPTETCTKGGLASYYGSVNYELDAEGRATVHDTNFMAYHAALGTSKDYITAVKYGYEVSENITNAIKNHTGLDIEVFPYSVFYVFYEQYLTMWRDTFVSIGYCLIGTFIFNLLASGFNILTTFAVMCTTVMVVVNMMGVMYIWNIPLNAVSCVNLIVSIGIAVEFCSHIAYAFATSTYSKDDKILDAMKAVGGTIITGITFTNIPIIVLAFSYTEIIEVFFFRMFFSLVLLGFIHGMIFFPVLLSYLNNLKWCSKGSSEKAN
uniref:SSD domain-containing protein n=1 Tax=Pectinophora gossypiella TaxID=13191 RepID=A0A1E1WQJ6_PECGO